MLIDTCSKVTIPNYTGGTPASPGREGLMRDCNEYSFLEKEDVQILHGDNFGSQLAFLKVLFGNSCFDLYKLKCLNGQFSLWKV